MKFTSLLHHVTPQRLESAYRQLNRQAASGIDGVSWAEYGEGLEGKLSELHERIQRGAYKPVPSRRTWIEKADGTLRPLGVATVEDRLVQRAVAEVLNAIYEEDFLGFCYGFRAGLGQHDALDALAVALDRRRVNWILDADIQSFFNTMGHEWMQRFLEHRIGDRRVVRLILRWLKAGVLENGVWSPSEEGTPQGASISPLLANVYLYYVFDQWAHAWRRKVAGGDVVIVRYADDFVVGFQYREDAERFGSELRQRLEKFGLTLHPDKTRILAFGRYAAERARKRGEGKPETFTFLGLTHICARDRQGRFALRRMSDRKRMNRKLQQIETDLRKRRHEPVPVQGEWLRSVIRGFDQYHGVPGNIDALNAFRREVLRLWMQSLRRRSQSSRVTQARMVRLSTRWIPKARIVHPWPERRFDARTCGRSRMR